MFQNDRGDNFAFDLEPNGLPLSSKNNHQNRIFFIVLREEENYFTEYLINDRSIHRVMQPFRFSYARLFYHQIELLFILIKVNFFSI